jgi:predicted DNA-binding transcriptional regulator AlpA
MLHTKPARYYTINQVAEICGVSRPTIDRWHRDRPDFPRKIALGENCARFLVTDIDAWLAKIEGGHRDG